MLAKFGGLAHELFDRGLLVPHRTLALFVALLRRVEESFDSFKDLHVSVPLLLGFSAFDLVQQLLTLVLDLLLVLVNHLNTCEGRLYCSQVHIDLLPVQSRIREHLLVRYLTVVGVVLSLTFVHLFVDLLDRLLLGSRAVGGLLAARVDGGGQVLKFFFNLLGLFSRNLLHD